MKKYLPHIILISLIVGIPAFLFSLFFLILTVAGVTGNDRTQSAIGFMIGSLYIIYKIWKDSPLNFIAAHKRRVAKRQLDRWNRENRAFINKCDREDAKKIYRDDYPGATSDSSSTVGFFGSDCGFGGDGGCSGF